MTTTTKFQVVSDVHLEFQDHLIPVESCEVLVLCGDILVCDKLHNHPLGEAAQRFKRFLRRCSDHFPHVLYVLGNHEHYQGMVDTSADVLRKTLTDMNLTNVVVLDNGLWRHNGVTWVGGTLWTDLHRGDPVTVYTAEQAMNDYRAIRVKGRGYQKFRALHSAKLHQETLDYFHNTIKHLEEPVVVVTHHAPHHNSIHPRYHGDHHTNANYYSDLSNWVLDHPQVAVWCHGHVHHKVDYELGGCRVVANPLGYPGENHGLWKPLVLTVG